MPSSKVDSSALVVFGLAIALMLLGLLIDSEAVGWLIAPMVLLLLIITMAKVPLRISLLALIFCVLVLENPAEVPACGRWKSPFYIVGALLLNHINTVTGVKALFMSGLDILLGALLLIACQREYGGAKIDRIGRVPTPRPLVRLAFVSLAGTAFVFLSGLVRGGDTSMMLWQIDRVIYLPLLFLLCHLGFRGPADHLAIGKVVIAAATLRAVAATIIIHTFYAPPDENGIIAILPYATTHGDSILFATGFVVLLALTFTRAGRRSMRVVYVVLPILVLGMISNHRRMVWVQVLLVPVAMYVLTPTNALKRKLQRYAALMLPVAVVYAAVGWNSGSSLFKPVRILRTVVDAKADNSTLWRDIENFDLIDTIKENPLFGTGYGHPYNMVVPLPAVDYSLEAYLPHNSILGMLSYSGVLGYAAMTMLWVAGAFFAMRGYYAATKPIDRAAAISCFGLVLICLIQCWGDLGLGAPTAVYLLAPALALAGKLAVSTGAWSDQKSKAGAAGRRGASGPSVAPANAE